MQPDEFFERVRNSGAVESEADAGAATQATLETLGERIGDSQAENLAASLPDELAAPLLEATPDEAESFGLDEFLDRVSNRGGMEGSASLVGVRAVLDALADAADEDEVADAREQLPAEFDLAFEAGEFVSADEFVDGVSGRAGFDSADDARNATTATLETLGERLSEGETTDLATYLPEEFRATITEPSDERPPDFGVEAFVSRIADREGVDEDAAESHAQAVLAVLSDAVADREFRRARTQLPDEYDALFEAEAE